MRNGSLQGLEMLSEGFLLDPRTHHHRRRALVLLRLRV